MIVPTDWERISGVQKWMHFQEDVLTCQGWSTHCTCKPEFWFARMVRGGYVGVLGTMCGVCFEKKKDVLETVQSNVMILTEDEFIIVFVMAS